MDSEPTTADEIEIARSCHFELKRGGGAYLRTAIRAFAGLPRLSGLDGISMAFEAAKGKLLSYSIGLRTERATGFLKVDTEDDGALSALSAIETRLERGIRTADAKGFHNDKDVDHPWAFETSELLMAAIRAADVDPADYLREIFERTKRRTHMAGTRHGAPRATRTPAPAARNEYEADRDVRNDLPWDMAPHLVGFDGRTVELREIRLSRSAYWGNRLHNDTEPALVVSGRLPDTLRVGAAGLPVNRLVEHPLLTDIDAPVTRVLRRGGAIAMLVQPGTCYMAKPPEAMASRIARMRAAVAAVASRNHTKTPIEDRQTALF